MFENGGIGGIHVDPLCCPGGEQVSRRGLDLADFIESALRSLSILTSPVNLTIGTRLFGSDKLSIAINLKNSAGKRLSLTPLFDLHCVVRIILKTSSPDLVWILFVIS